MSNQEAKGQINSGQNVNPAQTAILGRAEKYNDPYALVPVIASATSIFGMFFATLFGVMAWVV